jgi:hypothetical protein
MHGNNSKFLVALAHMSTLVDKTMLEHFPVKDGLIDLNYNKLIENAKQLSSVSINRDNGVITKIDEIKTEPAT